MVSKFAYPGLLAGKTFPPPTSYFVRPKLIEGENACRDGRPLRTPHRFKSLPGCSGFDRRSMGRSEHVDTRLAPGPAEMTLIHLFGLVTGARIQTILTSG